MSASSRRLTIWLPLIALVAGGLLWAFWPRAVAVDLAAVERGPFSVTIDEDGITRVRDIYMVSAPLVGRIKRIDADIGDPVVKGQTEVVRIEPSDPVFLDARSRLEIENQIKAARAAIALVDAEIDWLNAEYRLASAELGRARTLLERDSMTASGLDRRQMEFDRLIAQIHAAEARHIMREAELERLETKLLDPADFRNGRNARCCVSIKAPQSGNLLNILEESETVVQAGTPIVEIGDPRDLEIVVDVLSRDAVRIKPGADVIIEAWGGDDLLEGLVRRIEPRAYTKVSALGVEEQRVDIIVDITSGRSKWARLAHGFKLDARIEIWSTDDALIAPQAALFRHKGGWATFLLADGRAQLTPVQRGRNQGLRAIIEDGLQEGDQLVLYPDRKIEDGSRIKPREVMEN